MSAWPIPKKFNGQTVAVIAGGPSATPGAIASVRQYPRIAVRNAYQIARGCDVLLSLDGDDDWFEAARSTGFRGLMLSGLSTVTSAHWIGLRYERIRVNANTEIEKRNSGLAAIRVAAEMGATRILLVGFDPETRGYAAGYAPGVQRDGAEPYPALAIGLRALIAELAAKGVTVERVAEPVIEAPAPAEAATEIESRPRRRRIESTAPNLGDEGNPDGRA